MSHIVPIPTAREVRIAANAHIARWAHGRGLSPRAVYRAIHRYGGRTVDLTRLWGDETRGSQRRLADLPRPEQGHRGLAVQGVFDIGGDESRNHPCNLSMTWRIY